MEHGQPKDCFEVSIPHPVILSARCARTGMRDRITGFRFRFRFRRAAGGRQDERQSE